MDFRERLDDPTEMMHVALEGRASRIWTALPGIITQVDHTKMIVHVQPAVQARQAFPDGSVQHVDLPLVPDVPIMFPSGGGYTLTFPIKAGDTCLLHFASRNIDNWFSSGGVSAPLDNRMHDLSDAFATVGPRSQAGLLENVSTTTTQLRTDNGAVFIDLDKLGRTLTIVAPNEMVVTAGSSVTLDTPEVKATHNLTVGAGATGTFTAASGETVTVQDGIVVNIV